MFKFLLRGRRRKRDSPYSNSLVYSPDTAPQRQVGQSLPEDDEDDANELSPSGRVSTNRNKRLDNSSYFQQPAELDVDIEDEDGEGNGDVDDVVTPLLPIFSAAHLDRLPLYNITHSVRILIVQKCETTLSWDQLRSPQVSQFLVKPIQSTIRTTHFNRATLCALIANALQFQKESREQPGNTGVLQTRAMIAELLAMRLIKEFTTRELIDALSYDFDPLQGISPPFTGTVTPGLRDLQTQRTQARGARVSTVEIAIRAQAKRFLAHALVVQHLEAIWAGTIVFHSAADNLHRKSSNLPVDGRGDYGTVRDHSPSALPADSVLSRKAQASMTNRRTSEQVLSRRAVTLYDPRDASLFKLSRLRVPRYRQLFSTLSFAIMLGLFLAVLIDRSLHITSLEVLFWFWSTGYMLDEIVGFTEQGFGLYILSVWNVFDLGILLLFVTYYALRLYGIILAESGKQRISGMAYDVLASTAVLLFPRLFSVLDHYRYFSQLLIAFRMMAQDLMAILILILISCSGFFIAFTLSFSDDKTDGSAVAYALFQILMGFTPAAWDKWSGYNILGKAIMAMFLIICHFLIVTILITVLTNSFLAIVRNANEEHQFLFAVNTISMVKSDALFSYVAPTNIIEWICSPLRYVIPLRQFVKVNRTVIKITHFPVLFAIFSYERVILSGYAYEPTDLIERRQTVQAKPLAFSLGQAQNAFSPGRRLGEPSVISFNKDRALEEVFRRPFKGSTVRTTVNDMEGARQTPTNVVDNWMQEAENEGGASPPVEQPRSVLERLETRARPALRRSLTADKTRTFRREFSTASRSVISDPDPISFGSSKRPQRIDEENEALDTSMGTVPQETDGDGDDELVPTEVNEESDVTPGVGESAPDNFDKDFRRSKDEEFESESLQRTPSTAKAHTPTLEARMSHAARARLHYSPDIPAGSSTPSQAKQHPKRTVHNRNLSSATIMFAPQVVTRDDSSFTSNPLKPSRQTTNSGGTASPTTAARVSSRQNPKGMPNLPAPRARPIMPPRNLHRTAPNVPGLSFLEIAHHSARNRQPSLNARALDLASEIGDNRWAPAPSEIDIGGISSMPALFSEQLLRERELDRRREDDRRRSADEEKGMVNRIMLARMNTLEEGFREVIREVKDWSRHNSRNDSEAGNSQPASASAHPKAKLERPKMETVESGKVATAFGAANQPRSSRILTGNDSKQRKSPRKVQRRGTVEKDKIEGEEAAASRPGSGGAAAAAEVDGREETPSPDRSRVVQSTAPFREADNEPERPVTAVNTTPAKT